MAVRRQRIAPGSGAVGLLTPPTAKGFKVLNLALHSSGVDRIGSVRAAIIVIAALATRMITFGNPVIYSDEEFYFAAASAMLDGATPFVGIWDRKPIGLFLIYAGPAAMPWAWGVWAYQCMALASACATALIIARICDKAGWHRGGTLAGIAYLAWITVAGGQGGQSPIFYNLPMALAALLIIDRDHTWKAGVAAMSLVGLAIQIKYTAALEGMYFGLWLLFVGWRSGQKAHVIFGLAIVLCGAALLPTIAVMSYYAHIDALPEFVFANFQSILGRNPDPVREHLKEYALAAAILAPLLIMAVHGRLTDAEREQGVGPRIFLTGWLAAALLAYAVLPPLADHYVLPVLMPATIMVAGSLARPRGLAVGGVLILVVALAGQLSLVLDRKSRGTPDQFDALAQAVGRGPGTLYVYSSSSMLYPATERCAVSRYVFPSHLTRTRETGAIGVDQMSELQRIFRSRPEVVVVGPPYDGERLDIRRAAFDHLAKEYHAAAEVPLGRKHITVYKRHTASSGPVRTPHEDTHCTALSKKSDETPAAVIAG